MNIAGPRPGDAVRRAVRTLAGLALVLTGLAGAAPAHGTGSVLARLGAITVSATPLRPGPAGTLTASVRVSTSGQPSDQLDAAIAAGGAAVATLTVAPGSFPPPGATLAITLYFAQAGSVLVRLPVSRA